MTKRQMTMHHDLILRSEIRGHERTPTPQTSATAGSKEKISFLLLKEQLRPKLVLRNRLKFRRILLANLSTVTVSISGLFTTLTKGNINFEKYIFYIS